MKSLVKVLCALTVILGCATEPATSAEPKATDPAGDEINIRNVLKGFAEAWNRHDAEVMHNMDLPVSP
jgi:hypothetical protein